MKRRVNCSLIIIVIFGSLQLFSLENKEKKVILEEIIQEALEVNPRITAAEKLWEASIDKISQSRSLPDPVLSYSHFGQSIETKLGPQRNKISLSQRIPFFGKLNLKGEISKSHAYFYKEKYRAVKADIIMKVKEVFFSLYWFGKAIKISNEEREVLERLSKLAQKRYETGQANQQDVLKAQLEISKVLNKILLLRQGKRAAENELNVLLNRTPDAYVGKIEDFEIPEIQIKLDTLYEMAKHTRPELKMVQHLIEKNEKSLRLASKNYYPDFKLMFDYITIGEGTTLNLEDGRNSWMGSIGINIPLWRKKIRSAESEAYKNLEAVNSQYKNIENETISKLDELFFEKKTGKEQIRLYKYTLLPQAEQSFKASEIAYLTGKIGFLELLESERMVLSIKTGYYKILSDYGKSLSKIERLIGKKLF